MSDSVPNITDRELASKLKDSRIADAQKSQLEALIPKMSEAEKIELMNLIDRSHEEYKKASKAYNENLESLGKEYKQTLREQDKGFRKNLEGIERTETSQSLSDIQAEVSSIQAPSSKLKTRNSGGHGLRNLILALILLGLLAVGGLYLLNTLS